jgi:hypothetical protein
MASKKSSAKPTMAQAFNAAQGAANGKAVKQTSAAKPKDKGIVGEGKDVLKATGNSVKQQAEFVAAVGKGAAKGAGAIAKGAGKVAGKVANITVGDVASAPLDIAKNAGKAVAKVGKVLATPAAGGMMRAKMPSKPAAKKPVDTSKKGPSAGGKPVDRQYQGGSGSRKYPTNIPKGYTVLTLTSNPPKYKLVPKSGK